MKTTSLFLILSTACGFAQTSGYQNIVRQYQQGTGVVWDMTVEAAGAAPSALALESSGSLFQLWTINQTTGKDYLLDQKLVGAYLPKADIKVVTLDPYEITPRTRVDQPFSVEIQVADLLTGSGLPLASTKVLLEQHIQAYSAGQTTLDPAVVAANTPLTTAYIAQNGKTVLKFPASSLKASDPTKARGEEHFIVHALADGTITQSQIASAKVQVWPVASGSITGITAGEVYRYQFPKVKLDMVDLYPRSDTFFMLYEGTQVNGTNGIKVEEYPWDSSAPRTTSIESEKLDKIFKKDGTYTVALMSDTVFGTELLCPPITFSVKRSIAVNAMQVNFTGSPQP